MQYYRRGTTWMTAQQAREYDKRGGITVVEPDKEVVQEAVIEDKKEEVIVEEARDLPIVETSLVKLEDVAPIEIELPKEVPSNSKNKKK